MSRREVRGRVILLTGASRGIGRRAAIRLAAKGARLALVSRSQPELDSLVQEIATSGAEAVAFPTDLTDAAARAATVQAVVTRFGGLDIVVNCAGVSSFAEFADSDEATNRKVLEINFFAPMELIRLCLPHLTNSADAGYRAAILNVASICGRWGIPSLPEHCASKHAFVGMTEALRGEAVRFGVDVLLLLPGLVRSDDLTRHLLRTDGKIHLNFEGAQPPDEVAASLVRSLEKNRTEAAVGFVSWWVWFGRRVAPRAVRWVMHRKVANFARRQAKAAQ